MHKYLRVTLVLSCLGSLIAFPFPTEEFRVRSLLTGRALTPDNTCGNVQNGENKGYSCDPTIENGGGCCSSSGFCGKTSDYCGTGCQIGFGTCGSPSEKSLYECGPTHGNQICDSGLCCSEFGYCGNTTDYCGASCQQTFGDCTTKIAGDGNTCGPQFSGTSCTDGKCCSPSGYCGTGQAYCSDPDCQYKFGKCDSDNTPAGASTLGDPRPVLGQVPYDSDIFACTKPNVVALTYDDGPYLYTSQLLDILKSYGFHATFFITGNNLGKGAIDTAAPYPDLLRRMVAEGHQLASHTWSHYSLDEITTDMRKQQMVKNERAIANVIGKYPTYMRPPYSQCYTAGCQADMQSLGYHRVYFDLDSTDYLNPLPSQIQNAKDAVANALATTPHQLAIQHDTIQQSVITLSSFFFSEIQKKGWTGVTAGECLQDPQGNWYRTPGTGAGSEVSSLSSAISLIVSSSQSTNVAGGTGSISQSTNIAGGTGSISESTNIGGVITGSTSQSTNIGGVITRSTSQSTNTAVVAGLTSQSTSAAMVTKSSSQSTKASASISSNFSSKTATTTPKSTTPISTTPKSTTPKSTTPKSTTPKSTTPKSTTPKSTTPISTTPKPTTTSKPTTTLKSSSSTIK